MDLERAELFGIANSPNPTAIWVSDYPIQSEHGTYAYYRTFNIDTFEMNSELLKISETKLEEDSSVNDDDSLSLYIEAIDTETKNVLLCKSVSTEKQKINTDPSRALFHFRRINVKPGR